mmetsp:Transcript_10425/g.25924  ORF Transcript_10425/g.25924 Transcript_10425/m.25924 type:complete len:242 (+) Transcript_10425:1022-1747(+)
MIAPLHGRLLPLDVGAVGAHSVPQEYRARQLAPWRVVDDGRPVPLRVVIRTALHPRLSLKEAQLCGETKPFDPAERRFHVDSSSSRDDAHNVARVGAEGLETDQHGSRRRERVSREVLEVLQVLVHLVLLDDRAVEAEQDETMRGRAVGALHRLDREWIERLPAPQRAGARRQCRRSRTDTPHVMHRDLEPCGGRVVARELVILGEARSTLIDGHRQRRVELLDHVLQVEWVDSDPAIEHV